ncbi:glycosyltransferase 87 family protein [Micromonospora sp. NPDC093277]|uniref:glycosyltransferase 87 family protein n=1 Tax=Micromonospora sp. NPDC093277 TaxID=3364291 RepID=UPI0037F4FC8D
MTEQLTRNQRRALGVTALAVLIGVVIAVVPGHRGWFDVGVYHGAVNHWVGGGDLYEWTTTNGYGFTYPPFAAVCMLPMTLLAWYPTIAVSLAMTVVASGFVLHLLVDPLARRAGWSRWFAFALAACLFAALNPVRDTVSFGQVNLLLLALVYVDLWLLERGHPLAGIGTGLAAAIKLTPAVFIGYLLITRRWRAAGVAAGTAAAATAGTALLAPDASRRYFFEALLDTDRVGKLAYVSNQSLMGLVARLHPAHPDRLLWLVLVAGVLVVWLVRVRQAGRVGDDRAGFALTGIVGCLVSPVTWVHHLVWLAPALVVLADSTLPWPPSDLHLRRRLGLGVAGYLVLVSGVVWVWANGGGDAVALVGGNLYVLIALGLLIGLPVAGGGYPDTAERAGHAGSASAECADGRAAGGPSRRIGAGSASGGGSALGTVRGSSAASPARVATTISRSVRTSGRRSGRDQIV